MFYGRKKISFKKGRLVAIQPSINWLPNLVRIWVQTCSSLRNEVGLNRMKQIQIVKLDFAKFEEILAYWNGKKGSRAFKNDDNTWKKFVPHSLWMFQDSNFLQRSLTMIHQNLNLPFGRCSMYKSTVKTPLVVSITMDMIIPKVILLTNHGKQNVLILLTKKTLLTCQKIVFRQCLFVFLWFVYVRNIF